MMRFLTAASGRFRSAALSAAAVFAVITFAGSAPRAQTAPSAGPQARVVRLQQGRPFHGDLRQLPDRLPPQREHRPVENEREEPSLSRGGGDPAAQTSAPAAPAPAPGTGAAPAISPDSTSRIGATVGRPTRTATSDRSTTFRPSTPPSASFARATASRSPRSASTR
jgi:hypothetical protein